MKRVLFYMTLVFGALARSAKLRILILRLLIQAL